MKSTRIEVVTSVKKFLVAFRVVTKCGLAGRYQRFGGTNSIYLHPEDGGSMFLRNAVPDLQVHKKSQPRSLPWI
jgi:hypothetical protein